MSELLKKIPVFNLLADLVRPQLYTQSSVPGSISRREFLRLATLLGSSYAASRVLTGCAPTTDGERRVIRLESANPVAWGQPFHSDREMNAYVEDSLGNKQLESILPHEFRNKLIPVHGIKDCMFSIRLDPFGRALVPFDQLQIFYGDPFKYVHGHQHLGMRVSDPEFMKYVTPVASRVRIVGEAKDIGTDSVLDQNIRKAQEYGLKILFTFNPDHLLTAEEGGDEEIRRRVKELVTLYPGIELEIGNEMDNEEDGFWKGDLASFAHFASVAIKEARLHQPNIRIIIGAFLKLENTPVLVDLLKKEGIDTSTLGFALHSYDDVAGLNHRIEHFVKLMGKPPDVVSELGIKDPDKSQLPQLIKAIWKWDEKIEVYIHELVGHEDYGLLNPNGTPPGVDSDYCRLAELIAYPSD